MREWSIGWSEVQRDKGNLGWPAGGEMHTVGGQFEDDGGDGFALFHRMEGTVGCATDAEGCVVLIGEDGRQGAAGDMSSFGIEEPGGPLVARNAAGCGIKGALGGLGGCGQAVVGMYQQGIIR